MRKRDRFIRLHGLKTVDGPLDQGRIQFKPAADEVVYVGVAEGLEHGVRSNWRLYLYASAIAKHPLLSNAIY